MVDQALVARKPAGLSHVEAAGLALVGVTVWEALVERAGVRAGERVLVHGGAGGVGSVAVQVVGALGAQVVTTARARDHEFVTGLGADVAIDFSAGDHVPRVRALGGDTLTRGPEVLADRGRVVSIVDTPGSQNLLAAWSVNATYHFLFVRPGREKLAAVGRLVDLGELRPVIGAVLPKWTAPGGIGTSGCPPGPELWSTVDCRQGPCASRVNRRALDADGEIGSGRRHPVRRNRRRCLAAVSFARRGPAVGSCESDRGCSGRESA